MPEWITAIDLAALHAVTGTVHRLADEEPLALNWALRLLMDVNGLKMGLPVLLTLAVWLHPGSGYRADPLRALRGAAGIALALGLGRAAQNMLPPRLRPRWAMPDYPFPELGGMPELPDWSSMPSDHAALVFALAMVTWAGSRRLGLLSVAWGTFMVCLPRLYFGYHYLSDLVVGAAIGILAVAAAFWVPLPARLGARVSGLLRRVEARAPTVALLAIFLLGFEFMTQFATSRRMASAAGELAQALTGPPPERSMACLEGSRVAMLPGGEPGATQAACVAEPDCYPANPPRRPPG